MFQLLGAFFLVASHVSQRRSLGSRGTSHLPIVLWLKCHALERINHGELWCKKNSVLWLAQENAWLKMHRYACICEIFRHYQMHIVSIANNKSVIGLVTKSRPFRTRFCYSTNNYSYLLPITMLFIKQFR